MTTRSLIPFLVPLLASTAVHSAPPVKFNPAFIQPLPGSSVSTDLSTFERRSGLPAGSYPLDIYLRERYLQRAQVDVNTDGLPCVTTSLLAIADVADDKLATLPPQGCLNLASDVPGAQATLDSARNRLILILPGAWLKPNNDSVLPDLARYQNGIPSAHINYSVQHGETSYPATDTRTRFSTVLANWGIHSGDFLGGTSLNGTINAVRQDDAMSTQYLRHYLSHDIDALRSRLQAGQLNSNSILFGSYSFNGATLFSADDMRGVRYLGARPAIRGIADSNAVVEVFLNGQLLASRVVPPGPYALTDLPDLGNSQALDIIQKEENGSERRWRETFATLPNMLQAKQWRYQFAGGDLTPTTPWAGHANFASVEAGYGLGDTLTLYSGALISTPYQAVSGAISWGLGRYGAVSAQLNSAQSTPDGGPTQRGNAMQLGYSQTWRDTILALTWQRALSREYHQLQDFFALQPATESPSIDIGGVAGQQALSLTQWLGKSGQVSVSVSRQQYWSGRSDWVNTLSYATNAWDGQLNFSAYRQRSASSNFTQNVVQLSYSRAFGNKYQATLSHYQSAQQRNDSLMVSGSRLGPGERINASLSATQNNHNSTFSSNTNLTLPGVALNGVYTYNPEYRNTMLAASGALVLYRGGLTASPYALSDSFAMVEVPGVAGARLKQQVNSNTDYKGSMVASSITSYQRNSLTLEPRSLPPHYDVKNAIVEVWPRYGTTQLAHYQVFHDRRALVKLSDEKGLALPFGAHVSTQDGKAVGMVGQNGMLYATALPEHNQWQAQWDGQRCLVTFDYPESKTTQLYATLEEVCHQP